MFAWRRFFDRVLLVGAVVMAVVSLVAMVTTIQTVRDTRLTLNESLTFYVRQVEQETMQLLDLVEQFTDDKPTKSIDDVLIWFDILWSRVFLERRDILGGDPETASIATETIDAYRQALARMDPVIGGLTRDDTESVQFIKTELRNLMPVARKLSLAAKNNRTENQTMFLNSQQQQATLVFGLIIGMTLFGILSILLLRADQHQIRSMNTKLEDRVRQRTTDLQAANRRLAAEISERQRNQDIAADREARLEQAVKLAKLGYCVWDTVEDRCEYCSDQHAYAFGLTQSEFMKAAQSTEDAMSLIHPDDRERLQDTYQQLQFGHEIEVAYRIITNSGVRRLREYARPVFDASGTLIRSVASTLDVTDQFETEMKLFESQKMDSIGKMTGGVAHDFNNLLAVILGNLELLKEVPDSEDRDDMINDAISATLRGRDLTMNMLSFARRAPLDPSEIDLNEILSDMSGMLQRALPENINVDIRLADRLWTVTADRSSTESAVLNLAINARDAMPNGGHLLIETTNETLSEAAARELPDEIEAGDYVVMTVTDSGRGIKDDLLPHIFEPFFTTKSITKNSGLGLSMVQGFIRQTGGTIEVRSTPNHGTKFKLYFEATDTQGTDTSAPPQTESAEVTNDLRVLLVEDDDTVRKILMRQLENSGIDVVSACDSLEAEGAFAKRGPFDVIVSDIVMPGELQGPELIARLRQSDDTLPAVLLSGYPSDAIEKKDFLRADDVMLMKPVSRDDLLTGINLAINPQNPPAS